MTNSLFQWENNLKKTQAIASRKKIFLLNLLVIYNYLKFTNKQTKEIFDVCGNTAAGAQ